MIRTFWLFGILIVAVSLAGCRCRSCNQSFVNPLAGFGSPRVAPPGTIGYRPPANQPNAYYNNNNSTANLPNYNLAPNNGQANPNGQPNNNTNPNWRPVGNPNGNIQPGSNPMAYQPPPGYPTNLTTLASNTTSIRSTDYRTTRIDERNDPTRMPVSDASSVRAPARFVPNGNVAFAQNQAVPIRGQYQYQAQPRLHSVPNGVLANASTANYGQNGTFYANNGYPSQNGFNNPGAVQANWQASGQNNFSR